MAKLRYVIERTTKAKFKKHCDELKKSKFEDNGFCTCQRCFGKDKNPFFGWNLLNEDKRFTVSSTKLPAHGIFTFKEMKDLLKLHLHDDHFYEISVISTILYKMQDLIEISDDDESEDPEEAVLCFFR